MGKLLPERVGLRYHGRATSRASRPGARLLSGRGGRCLAAIPLRGPLLLTGSFTGILKTKSVVDAYRETRATPP